MPGPDAGGGGPGGPVRARGPSVPLWASKPARADQDFAAWAQDEISHGCSTNYQSDASYQATTAPDDQATKDKKAFAALWTAIANEYGLPLYRYNQI